MVRLFFAAAGVLATLLLVIPTDAQQPGERSPQLATIFACRSQVTDRERLLCYDRAVLALARAAEQGKVVVVDREDVRRTRRSLFGFSLPTLPFFRGDDSLDDAPDFIEAKMKSARPIGHNKWLIGLEDGAMWQTTEPDTRGTPPKAGETVRIRKGAMGSYTLLFNKSRPLRGMRVR